MLVGGCYGTTFIGVSKWVGSGNVNSVEWSCGMERWSGLLDWITGVPRPQCVVHSMTAHATITHRLRLPIDIISMGCHGLLDSRNHYLAVSSVAHNLLV